MRKSVIAACFCCLLALILATAIGLKAQYSDKPAGQTEAAPPSDEGPNKSVGETVIVPRKRPTQPPQPAPQPKKEKIDPDEAYTLRSEVDLVNVGVVVQSKKGEFLPGLQKENFRILEDGVPQTIKKLEAAEAPMTVAMLIEFSSLYWEFLYETMVAAYGFVQTLRPEDWIAVIAFDMRPEILQDFTKNKAAAFGALQMMRIPGFSESNMFDALSDTLSRMDNIDGKKAILLISSGVDTFSKTRYDHVLKQVQASDTPVYAIGTGQAVREWYDARGYMGADTNIGFLQADNQLRSFARLSGGKAYFPRFEGQFGEIYNDISASLRNEYNISYTPTNPAHDGKFRKLKVELVDADGKPLKLVDQKGKEIKYEIRAREGYYAPRPVE
ncbi:MAG: VWA domain-containing protein [Acidobacteria bacterium]|nr:VWA domain-containing protein [Acidobacteriota bacterium]